MQTARIPHLPKPARRGHRIEGPAAVVSTQPTNAVALVMAMAVAGAAFALTGCGAPAQPESTVPKMAAPSPMVAMPAPMPFPVSDGEGRVTKLLRFPDVHQNLVVFTYGGDLWLVPTTGGTASRLTSHPGLELFAKFSPDGKWVAFTGQYGGDEQIYIVSVGGGEPRQLTYYPARGPLPARWGYDNQVYGFTPDGTRVLFRSLRDSFDIGNSKLYTVPVAGGAAEPLPMPSAGAGDVAPDGDRLVYSPLFRDFRTWKRYSGGWAQDLYIFDPAGPSAVRITDDPHSDRDPMWVGQDIFFNSDRSGTSNLYKYNVEQKSTTPITSYDDWDVRWPSADAGGQIVFEQNGELSLLTAESGQVRKLDIYVPDDGMNRRPQRISAAGNIEHFDISPKAERALFIARGDLFSVPTKHGLVRNLTHSPNAHERDAAWSPDGEQLVYISDASGEEELWVIDHRGQSEPRQLTRGNQARLRSPIWSPNGRWIAYSDQNGKLFVIPATGGQAREVADEPYGYMWDYRWSPDGRHLAFSLNDQSFMASIYIWSASDSQTRRITGELFDEGNPVWHPSGEYIYFVSRREFQPQIDVVEWNYARNRDLVILGMALNKDAANPFGPRNDEVGKQEDKGGADDKGAAGAKDKSLPQVKIDFDGLSERIFRVPLAPDNYGALGVTKTHLIYRKTGAFYYGRDSGTKPVLFSYDMKERKETKMAADVSNWAISDDGSAVLVKQGPKYRVLAVGKPAGGPGGAPGAGGDADKPLPVDKLMVTRIPAQEWQVVFGEVWRRFRDFFYVDNMHGYDWQALRAKYEPLLAHVGHRSDLNYLIGEMIAELNVSHAYVAGGDEGLPKRPNVALLGARFSLDGRQGRYRISSVFRGQNSESRYRAPLTEVGVEVAEGDYVLAINGQELTPDTNPYQLLHMAPGQPVELLLNSRATMNGARTVLVEPLSTETDLLYLAWVADNRRKVAEATDGRVGYLHIPDMGPNGIREFIKWYYGQVRKEGLVIDVRGNGGGNVSQMLIERLRRTLMGVDFARHFDHAMTYPNVVFHGHMVTLINETSASDGDIFPWMFRNAGLGPLIGKRTWGGIIGITNHGPLIDGGSVFVPQFGNASADGQWVIEGVGVAPDIEVENNPVAVMQGRDPQLERAIAEVMKSIEADPKRLPARPAPPVKTPERQQTVRAQAAQ